MTCYECYRLLGTIRNQDGDIVPICSQFSIQEAPSVKDGCSKNMTVSRLMILQKQEENKVVKR